MIIQSRIQGQGLQSRSLGAIGVWSVIVLCGSLVAACSGTIDTPTEEFPPRQGNQASNDDDDNDSPRPPANPPTASNNDDDDEPAPAASNDDDEPLPTDEDPPADDEDPPADDEDPPAADLTFEADIFPILESTCGPCHTAQPPNLAGPDIDSAFDAAVAAEDRMFIRIEMGGMPQQCAGGQPGDPGCISVEDLATLEAWYDAGAPE